MAKRKRLGPANPAAAPVSEAPPRAPLSAPPIAQVAGDAAALSALREVSDTLATARAEGRFVDTLPLDAVDPGYLTRDRMALDPDDLAALEASLRARGQQTPIEVVDLGDGRYGLISGWRRLTALGRIGTETVQAIVRVPDSAGAAYVAMVEENEIRVGLSYFERARIVAECVAAGVYPSDKKALQSLFSTASRAKRSKIGSFLPVVRALGGALRFPAALPERVGLQLAKALEHPEAAATLTKALTVAAPDSPEAERAVLTQALKAPRRAADPAQTSTSEPDPTTPPLVWDVTPGIRMERRADGLLLSGPGIDPTLEARLRHWLKTLPR